MMEFLFFDSFVFLNNIFRNNLRNFNIVHLVFIVWKVCVQDSSGIEINIIEMVIVYFEIYFGLGFLFQVFYLIQTSFIIFYTFTVSKNFLFCFVFVS